jgi:hypothetical protein
MRFHLGRTVPRRTSFLTLLAGILTTRPNFTIPRARAEAKCETPGARVKFHWEAAPLRTATGLLRVLCEQPSAEELGADESRLLRSFEVNGRASEEYKEPGQRFSYQSFELPTRPCVQGRMPCPAKFQQKLLLQICLVRP